METHQSPQLLPMFLRVQPTHRGSAPTSFHVPPHAAATQPPAASGCSGTAENCSGGRFGQRTAGPQHEARAPRSSPHVGTFSHFQPALNSAEARTVHPAGTKPWPPPLLSIWAGAVLRAYSPSLGTQTAVGSTQSQAFTSVCNKNKIIKKAYYLCSKWIFLLIIWQEAQFISLVHHIHDQGQYSHVLPALIKQTTCFPFPFSPVKTPVLLHPHYQHIFPKVKKSLLCFGTD